MRYREVAAPEDVRSVVQAMWVVEGVIGEAVRVVPDACVDLIAMDDGVGEVLLNGPMPVAEVVTLAAPRVHGLRLVPGTLPRLGAVRSLAEVRGAERVVPGPGFGGAPLVQLLDWARTLFTAGILERNADVDAVLSRQASGASTTATRRVGPRQMQRLFATYVGLSPQETFGVVRQSLVARALRSGDGGALAVLAADHGYADQAHLTRAFTRLAGVPQRRRWHAEPPRQRRHAAADAGDPVKDPLSLSQRAHQ